MVNKTDNSGNGNIVSEKDIIGLNLGIDFGTSFTKVCYRNVGREQSGVITFDYDNSDPEKLEGAIIPSRVAIEPNGKLRIPDEKTSAKAIMVPYLKMRLTGQRVGGKLPKIKKLDLNQIACIKGLCSWYLANIIVRSQEWLYNNEKEMLIGQIPDWTACIGVPVQVCDSKHLKRFKEVFCVAWLWAMKQNIPDTLEKAVKRYKEDREEAEEFENRIHPIPEITAAVHSFISSRNALPGLYVYFDIGAGTMDGATFRFQNIGGKSISYFTGRVENLGVCILYEKFTGETVDFVSEQMLDKALSKASTEMKDKFENDINRLTGHVISQAKKKNPGDWREIRRDFLNMAKKGLIQPTKDDMDLLPVFVGGGGSKSEWYKECIKSTYERFKHKNAGIPPYELSEVPKADDLELNEIPEEQFFRFVISYGLSIPLEEHYENFLPSEVKDAELPDNTVRLNIVDYSDSKDVYD